MNESLYLIEDTLEQIQMQRQIAEAEGDSEALKVIDQIEREYLTKEAAKVTSYVALIRSRGATVLACQQERKRIADIQNAAHRDIDRLKANALEAMQRFGVKELKATPGGGFRRQANGGLQALETDVNVIEDDLLLVTVTMPRHVWDQVEAEVVLTCDLGDQLLISSDKPNTDLIRDALKRRRVCPECGGVGYPHDGEGYVTSSKECQRCEGSGNIPNTVPGAKLLPRGEHVKIS
jgi:hypothetical protein